jgi:hypothetical protein
MRPLIAQQPGWSLLQRGDSTRSTPAPRATSGKQRGVPWIRGRARGSHSIAGVGTSPDGPIPGSSATRSHRLWRDDGERRLGVPTAEMRAARDKRGQKPIHAPSHGRERRGSGCAARKDLRSKALTGTGRACSPGDQGHACSGRSPGCVVKRSLDRRTSGIERSAGCSCTWSVADVDKTHLPPGARPAERQTANHRVTSCGGLLGDDERPIRSGRKGAKLMRANRFVRAQRPAFIAR